jgi:hypothetical protein
MDTPTALKATTNATAKFAKQNAPTRVKNILNDAKHLGANGVNTVLNSRVGRFAADKTDQLIGKVRSGQALSFGNTIKKAGTLKVLGDFGNTDAITQIMIILIGLLFFVISFWCFNKLSLNAKNCKNLTALYSDFPLISSISPSNPNHQYKMRDYYIKTAYNCCSGGNFKNDFVNLCALKNCIKQGARCLDFEIYSIGGVPAISVSSKKDYNVKEAYNSILFADAMTVVSTYAFSGGTCPNPNDPLILHFRFMSNNAKIYDQMATILYNTMENQLLGKNFSYEDDGQNIGSYPISRLMGQVIIMADKSNTVFSSTKINEYVNITSNSVFVRNMRYTDVKFCPDADELLEYNKQNMTICLPDLSGKNKNYSPALVMSYGCQFVGMSFQNFDPYMQYYTEMFDDAGSAFILRPERYRYIPLFIVKPPPQDPNYSYANRDFTPAEGIKTSPI